MQGINTLIFGLLCVNLVPYSQMILDPVEQVSVVHLFSEVGTELFKTFVTAPPLAFLEDHSLH